MRLGKAVSPDRIARRLSIRSVYVCTSGDQLPTAVKGLRPYAFKTVKAAGGGSPDDVVVDTASSNRERKEVSRG